AAAHLNMAEACIKRLPSVHAALLAGHIDYPKALVFTDATSHLDDTLARQLVDQLLPEARVKTTAQLRDKLRRLILKADPDAAKQRQRYAHAARGLTHRPDPDGTATLTSWGLDPIRTAQAVGRINAIAHWLHEHGDARTMGQLRAD